MRRFAWLIAPFALALLLGLTSAPALAGGDHKAERAWKHLVIPQSEILHQSPNGITRVQRIEAELNQLGQQGWELAAVSDEALDGEAKEPLYLFKKPGD